MKKSAGILLFNHTIDGLKFFLVHPGGPFWKNKDEGAWSIPKGELGDNEDPLDAAKREFQEETGAECKGKFIELKPLKQKSGKLIFAWAVEQNIDPASLKSNVFEMEWPPRSGKYKSFPEIDRGEWFSPLSAKQKINAGQVAFIDELVMMIDPSYQK